MHVDTQRYTLTAKASLNCLSKSRQREGALLRFTFEDGLIGYADCHPWVELGDAPLDQQIQLLNQGKLTPLTTQSTRFARLDAEARANKINLLSNLPIPFSHFLINDLENFQIDELLSLQCQGFTHLKIKMGKDLPKEIAILEKLANSSIGKEFKLRLDFNSHLQYQTFIEFLEKIKKHLNLIDFIEDPIPYQYEQWSLIQQTYPISLACDHQVKKAIGFHAAAHVLILKPAIHHEKDFIEKKNPHQKIVVTSYLDHPFGQACAAYIAAMINQSSPCGLMSHVVYENTPFSSLLSNQTPQFQPNQGYGFGFDALLKKEQAHF